jgi:hypothetical protein
MNLLKTAILCSAGNPEHAETKKRLHGRLLQRREMAQGL